MQSEAGSGFFEQIDLQGRMVRASNFVLDQWWLWLLLGVAIWLALKLRAQHALIAKLDERAEAAFADIDALMLERKTLVGNLVEVVRAFATREHDVIRDVIKGRIDALAAISEADALVGSQTAGLLQNLVSLDEAYPRLASEGHYASLRGELTRVEERLTASRRFYNLAVEEVNSVRRAFPGNLIAPAKSAPLREKFTLGEERRALYEEPAQITL